jgi:hypothetical protein
MRSHNTSSQLMEHRWFTALVDAEGTLLWSGLMCCWEERLIPGGAVKILQQPGCITKRKRNVNKACELRLLSEFPSFKAERNAEDSEEVATDLPLPLERLTEASDHIVLLAYVRTRDLD